MGIIKKGSPENGGGTWFHPKLAIPFARWLEARFAIWCNFQIEDFRWRHQVLFNAWQNLQNATIIMTFTGSELLIGKRLF
ncbi:MAG: hypothetical protein RL637_703 [Pseudomonadota bacterium]